MIAAAIGLIILSGLCYRIRGSSWTSDDASLKGLRVAKLAVGAMPVALACYYLGVDWRWCLGVWVLTAAADTLPHAKNQGAVNWAQALDMIFNALIVAGPAAFALWFAGLTAAPIISILASVLIAPAYWIGNRLPIHFTTGPIGFREGPELGEVLYGMTRAVFAVTGAF